MRKIKEIMMENARRFHAIDYGYGCLMCHFSQFNTNEVITLFGYPDSGKTSFMLNLVSNICKNRDTSILYISTDKKAKDLTDMLIQIKADLKLKSRHRKYKPQEEIRLKIAEDVYDVNDLYITEAFDHNEYSDQIIEKTVLSFLKNNNNLCENRMIILDEYYDNPVIVEKLRKIADANDTLLFIVATHKTENKLSNDLDVKDLDPYLQRISDTILSIHRPLTFTENIKTEKLYVNILKTQYTIPETIEYSFNNRTLNCTEVDAIDRYHFDPEVDWDSDIDF